MTSQILKTLFYISVSTVIVACLPFIHLKFQWVSVMHVVVIGAFAVMAVKMNKEGVGLVLDPFFVILIILFGLNLFTVVPYTPKSDGSRFWLESHGQFVRYVKEYDYHRSYAGYARVFSLIHSVCLYAAVKAYSPYFMSGINRFLFVKIAAMGKYIKNVLANF